MTKSLLLCQFADAESGFGFIHIQADGGAHVHYRVKPMSEEEALVAMAEHGARHTPTHVPGGGASLESMRIPIAEPVSIDWAPPKNAGPRATQIFMKSFRSALEDLDIDPVFLEPESKPEPVAEEAAVAAESDSP